MLCRLCVYEVNQESLLALFNDDEESDLTKLITKYMHIEVSPTDDFSTMICKECYQHLNDFHNFFQHVEKRQYVLQNEFSEVNSIVTERATPVKLMNAEYIEMEPLLDIKDVFTTKDSNMDKTMPQIEFEFANENYHSNLEAEEFGELNEKEDKNKILLKSLKTKKVSSVKRHVNKEEISKESKNKLKYHRARMVMVKQKDKTTKRKKKSSTANTASKLKTVKSEERIDEVGTVKESANYSSKSADNNLINDMIAEHMHLKCEICDTPVQTFKDLKSHFQQKHNAYTAFVTCCGSRFYRRFLLVDHIQKHLNPEQHKCKICSKVLKSKICLNAHFADMHANKSELKHPCTLCDRRFAHSNNLAAHMMSHTDERNHQCKICNKAFKLNYTLKVHIRTMHEQCTPFICDTCGKEFKYKTTFDRHVAEHQGLLGDQQQECPICGKWYALTYIKRHVKRHDLANVDCEKCGKTFKSKAALSSHCHKSHGKTRIYSCIFCDKTFDRSTNLKEHIGVHTGEKEYNCAHCPREFRSKANMYAHVKKMHFELWTQAQLGRYRAPNSTADNSNS